MSNIEWTQTDPDLFQFGRKIKDGVYQFKEFNWWEALPEQPENLYEAEAMEDYWEEMQIDLDNYTDEQIQNYISAYYDSVDEIKENYSDWKWIVAECIFEQEVGLY